MDSSNTSKVGITSAGVAGSAIAVVCGVGSYEGEAQNILLIRQGTHSWGWRRAADRYFVNLIENPNLENKLPSSDNWVNPKESNFFNFEAFRDTCLALSQKVGVTSEEKLKRDTWCKEFKSVFDHWEKMNTQKEINLFSDSEWSGKYDLFVSKNGNVKNFLESLKSSNAIVSEEKRKSHKAIFWCRLLSNKEYEEFKSKCIKN